MTRRTAFRPLFALILALALLPSALLAEVATPGSALATSTVTETDFPVGMRFRAEIALDAPADITGASLLYRVAGDDTLNLAVVPAENIAIGENSVSVDVFIDFQQDFLPLGSSLTWTWELQSADGDRFQTAEESGGWRDPRFEWTLNESEQVRLYTYAASDEFAGWMLDETQTVIDDLESRYGLEQIDPVTIWIYPEYGAFAATMQANSRESVAGISYPGSSLITAIIRDGDEREYGRVIPHEISHQVLYHATHNPFAFAPMWLDEGLATRYQVGGTDHYPGMVRDAAEDGRLFTITSLNASFPYQPAQATLAYAASWSFLGFLEETYGPEGIAALIDALAAGMSTDEAVQDAFGASTDDLNEAWLDWVLGQSADLPRVA